MACLLTTSTLLDRPRRRLPASTEEPLGPIAALAPVAAPLPVAE